MKRSQIPEDDCVTLEVEVDLDGATNVIVQARTNGFAGSASGWLHINDVVTFGRTIRDAYPLLANERYSLDAGYGASLDQPAQTLFALTFYQVDPRGTVGCCVELAAPRSPTWRNEKVNAAKLFLKTSYEELRRFGGTLSEMASDPALKAILLATF
jgi:hypothetical protein